MQTTPSSRSWRLEYPRGNPLLEAWLLDLTAAGVAHSELIRLAIVYYLSPTQNDGETKIRDYCEILEKHYTNDCMAVSGEFGLPSNPSGYILKYLNAKDHYHGCIAQFVYELAQNIWFPTDARIYLTGRFISVFSDGQYIHVTSMPDGVSA